MRPNSLRHPSILIKEKTALIVIDIQEKILCVMHNPETLIQNTVKLIEGFKILEAPIFSTEQYPKGLGETESRIKNALANTKPTQKMTFSCLGAEDLFAILEYKKIKQVVLAGIESHVCVQQTALDLLANGFQVNLAADACSSRHEIDYNIALDRMRTAGVIITTTEAILFEMLNICGTDVFKKISKIVK
ncbi:MAG: hydrolase [Ignavibacteriaceae bacterium]|nr:hydrolase [Ignavibacteriaceae bacterium]